MSARNAGEVKFASMEEGKVNARNVEEVLSVLMAG